MALVKDKADVVKLNLINNYVDGSEIHRYRGQEKISRLTISNLNLVEL